MKELLSVNGQSIDIKEAIRRDILHESTFLNAVIEELVIRQIAAKRGIENSTEELQVAVDEKRYQKGLESVEKTKQWMAGNHQTMLSVQNGMDYQLLRNKLRNAITEEEMKAWYNDHKLSYESIELFSIRCETEAMAQELMSQIDEDGEPFMELAKEHSSDENTAYLGGYVGRKTREDVTAEIEAAAFSAEAGKVIGPIKTEKGWNLFKVENVKKPDFESAKDSVRMDVFKELIAQAKAEAKIDYSVFAESE